jgi:hypothetical protein
MSLTPSGRELVRMLGQEAVLWRPEDLMLCELQLRAGVSRARGERRALHIVGLLDEACTSLTESS